MWTRHLSLSPHPRIFLSLLRQYFLISTSSNIYIHILELFIASYILYLFYNSDFLSMFQSGYFLLKSPMVRMISSMFIFIHIHSIVKVNSKLLHLLVILFVLEPSLRYAGLKHGSVIRDHSWWNSEECWEQTQVLCVQGK